MTTIAAMGAEVDMPIIASDTSAAATGGGTTPLSGKQQISRSVVNSRPSSATTRPQSATRPRSAASNKQRPATYSGINLFTWLRILLRQFQGDQLQRLATFQLMLDTVMANNNAMPTYSQFSALAKSLFDELLSESEIMTWFVDCCEDRRGKRLTADVIFKAAERLGFFLRSFQISIVSKHQESWQPSHSAASVLTD